MTAENPLKTTPKPEVLTVPDQENVEAVSASPEKTERVAELTEQARLQAEKDSIEAAALLKKLSGGSNEEESRATPEYNQAEGLAKIQELLAEKLKEADGPVIVEVAGGSASGKGVISKQLKEIYGTDVTYIEVDDYYRGGKFVEDEAKKGNVINFDQPEAIDLERFKKDLADLKEGKTIKKPIFDFKRGEPSGETIDVVPSKIVVADGLFVLGDAIASVGDVRVFVEVGTHGRIIRRLLRDIERTSQKPKDILNYFAKFVQPMHDKYIESTKPNADVVVRNEYSPKVESLRSGLHEKQLKFEASAISREQILAAGATLIEAVDQRDIYYNPADRNLADTDEILRIREDQRPPEMTAADVKEDEILTFQGPRTSFAYKGPRIENDASTLDRPKFEFEIDEDVAKNVLSLYPDAIKVITKRRELYELEGVSFSLDDVTVAGETGQDIKLGKFIELRSSNKTQNEAAASDVMSKLGLKMESGIKKAYAEM